MNKGNTNVFAAREETARRAMIAGMREIASRLEHEPRLNSPTIGFGRLKEWMQKLALRIQDLGDQDLHGEYMRMLRTTGLSIDPEMFSAYLLDLADVEEAKLEERADRGMTRLARAMLAKRGVTTKDAFPRIQGVQATAAAGSVRG